MTVTLAEKLACAEREVRMRKSAYPKWVERKKMGQSIADHELKCMEAIVDDYRALVAAAREEDQPSLL